MKWRSIMFFGSTMQSTGGSGTSDVIDEFIFDDELDMSINQEPKTSSKHDEAIKLLANISSCPISELEIKILSIICPIFHDSVIQYLTEIESTLEASGSLKNPRIFDEKFIKISEQLDPWNKILDFIKSGEKISASLIRSVIDKLPNLIIKICGHRKSKRGHYPKNEFPPLLVDVFRKTCTLARHFYTVLNQAIEFQSTHESQILEKLLKEIGQIGNLIQYDLSTMGQTWKTFGRLAFINKNVIIENGFSEIVTDNFKEMGEIINWLYKDILKSGLEIFERRGKCSVFLLNILDRLYVIFCRSRSLPAKLVRDTQDFIIHLSANHVMCTGSTLGANQHELYKIRAKIFTTNWPKTFTNYYIESDDFWNQLLEKYEIIKRENHAKTAFGFQCLLLNVSGDWKQEEKFLDIAIDNLNHIQEELLLGAPEIAGFTDDSDMTNIYNTTFLIIRKFLVTKSHNFPAYENILLKHLLGENFWPSLMSYDVLQYCYKITDDKLPFAHIQYFISAYETSKKREENSLAITMLERSIIDIFSILPEEKKKQLISKCKDPVSLMLLLSETETDRHLRIIPSLEMMIRAEPGNCLSDIIADLKRQPSVKNWNRLINLLTVMSTQRGNKDGLLIDKLCEVWSFVVKGLNDFSEGSERKLLVDTMMLLLDCARVDQGSSSYNWILASVLFTGISHTSDLSSEFLVKLCHYLNVNVHRFNAPCYPENISVLSNLFCSLLEHKCEYVRQEALEAFDQIVETCTNEQLVRGISSAIARRPCLRETVPAYLTGQKILSFTPEISSSDDYLKLLSRHSAEFSLKHQCHEDNEPEHEEKVAKLLSNDPEQRVDNVCQELINLSRQKNYLSSTVVKKLSDACQEFLDREYLN